MKNDKDKPMTYHVATLGCKVNQFESEALAQSFEESGYIQAPGGQGADLCLVNTCAVTQKAAMQSRQAVRKIVRSNPQARIVVTGCYAQTHPEEIKAIKGVHAIVGHADKAKIPELGHAVEGKKGQLPLVIGRDLRQETRFEAIGTIPMGKRTRPFVKIQDGCDAFCSYCIVPHARGRSRSLPPNAVINQLNQLNSAGYYEAVLTGIHLGCYGVDLKPLVTLFDLLRKIDAENAIYRVRLSAIEPKELNDDIIRFVATSDERSVTLCRHFHIPLQSGDDRILERMRRPYNGSFFQSLTAKIIEAIPEAAIGVDVLVGFPGETEQAFERTYQLLKNSPVAYFHVFPFSPRTGTPASRMTDRVETKVVQLRSKRMRGLGHKKREAFYKRSVGTKVTLLVEKKLEGAGGIYKGISDNYIPVLVKSKQDLTGKPVTVTIIRFDNDHLVWGAVAPSERGVSE